MKLTSPFTLKSLDVRHVYYLKDVFILGMRGFETCCHLQFIIFYLVITSCVQHCFLIFFLGLHLVLLPILDLGLPGHGQDHIQDHPLTARIPAIPPGTARILAADQGGNKLKS